MATFTRAIHDLRRELEGGTTIRRYYDFDDRKGKATLRIKMHSIKKWEGSEPFTHWKQTVKWAERHSLSTVNEALELEEQVRIEYDPNWHGRDVHWVPLTLQEWRKIRKEVQKILDKEDQFYGTK